MRAALVAVLLVLALPAGAAAAPELVPVGDFSDPVALAAPPRDAARLFVVQRGGQVRLVKDGVPLAAPFADLSAFVVAGGERGLLGMAFPPDYAASGLAYVFLTASSPAGELQVRELRRSPDPDRAVAGAVRLRPTRKGARRLRRALARHRRPTLRIRIAARDAAGNVRVRRARIHLRR